MPSLVVFGQRTLMGGDDLDGLFVLSNMSRLVQVVLVIYLFVVYSSAYNQLQLKPNESDIPPDCFDREKHLERLFVAFLSMGALIAVVGVILEAFILRIGHRGTPVQQATERKSLPLVCEIYLVQWTVLRLVAGGIGFVFFGMSPPFVKDCLNTQKARLLSAHRQVIRALALLQLIELGISILVFLSIIRKVPNRFLRFALHPFAKDNRTGDNSTSCFVRCCLKWSCWCCCTACSFLTCCVFGGKDTVAGRGGSAEGLSDLSTVLADYFMEGRGLDIVFSDILTGLVLVVRQQREQEEVSQYALKRAIQRRLKLQETGIREEPEPDGEKQHEENEATGASTNDSFVTYDDSQEMGIEIPASKKAIEYLMSDSFMQGSNGDEMEDDEDEAVVYVSRRREDGTPFVIPKVVEVLEQSNATERFAIAEAARFLKYCLSIYTWIMYSVNRPLTGYFELLGKSAARKLCGEKKRNGSVAVDETGDEEQGQRGMPPSPAASQQRLPSAAGETVCCPLHETALLAELPEGAIVKYAQFQMGVEKTPYMIALDTVWRSIVIAVRGTLSLDDAVADISLRPSSLMSLKEECGLSDQVASQYVHSGMLGCSRWIYRDIQEQGILQELIDDHPDFDLRVTGHSLGAGSATILTLLLRPAHPNVRCLAFAPPGCTVDGPLSEQSLEWCTSFVLDSDIVPRLSIESVQNLRNDIWDAIACMKVPKYEIFSAAATRFSRRRVDMDDEDYDDEYHDRSSHSMEASNRRILHRTQSMPDSDFQRQVQELRLKGFAGRRQRRGTDLTIELFPPGRMVHLFPAAEQIKAKSMLPSYLSRLRSGGRGISQSQVVGGDEPIDKSPTLSAPLYTPMWADKTDFREVRLTSHFLYDHDPLHMLQAFSTVANDSFGLTRPYFQVQIDPTKDEEHRQVASDAVEGLAIVAG